MHGATIRNIMSCLKLQLWLCYAIIEIKKKLSQYKYYLFLSPKIVDWALNYSCFFLILKFMVSSETRNYIPV